MTISLGAFMILMLAGQVMVVLYQIHVYGPNWLTWSSIAFTAISCLNIAFYVLYRA